MRCRAILENAVFSISSEDYKRIDAWLHEVIYPPILERQKSDPLMSRISRDMNGREVPYLGAIGGGVTYCFTPTSLGTTLVVRWSDGQELDLTDYSMW